MKIEIKTKIPTVNSCYYNTKRGRSLTAVAYAFKNSIAREVEYYLRHQKNYGDFPVFEGKVYLNIKCYFKKRGRDVDNALKLIQDSLQGVLYKNDSSVYTVVLNKEDDKKIVNGVERLELEFFEIE